MPKINPNAKYITCGILYDVPLEIISFQWRQNYCRWRATKFGLALILHYLWARRDRYRATNVVTWGPRFFFGGGGVLIWRTAPFWSPLTTSKGFLGLFLPVFPKKRTVCLFETYYANLQEQLRAAVREKKRGKVSNKRCFAATGNRSWSIHTFKVAYWML